MPKVRGKSGHPRKLYLTTDTTVLTFYCQIDGTEHDIKEAVFVWDIEDGKMLKICGNHRENFRYQLVK